MRDFVFSLCSARRIRRDSRSTALLKDIGSTYRFIKMIASVSACQSLAFQRAAFFQKHHNYCINCFYIILISLAFQRGKLGVIARFSTMHILHN
jgi:hypothetical protein